MMDLSTYLATSGTKQIDLAEAVGVKRSHMSLMASGARRPSRRVAVLIEKATGGLVPASIWDDQPQGAAQ